MLQGYLGMCWVLQIWDSAPGLGATRVKVERL